MSSSKDSIAEALSRTKRLAAARQVRKAEIEPELARWKTERARLADDPHPPELDEEIQSLTREVDARIAALSSELATVENDLRAALTEMTELGKLARTAERADTAAVVASASSESDPIIRSDEEIALDNVRGHIADLDARVRVQREIAATEKGDHPDPDPDPAAPPPGGPPKRTF